MTHDPNGQHAHVARRPLIHAAWVAPVVAIATSAPAYASISGGGGGGGAASITLFLENYSSYYIVYSVNTTPPPQPPATSNHFDLEGFDAGSGSWVLLYENIPTDATGHSSGTFPHVVLDDYPKVRARMQVMGGYVYSAEVPVPKN